MFLVFRNTITASLILGALFFAPIANTYGAVEKLVFVSESAVAEVGAVTSVLTVQSQDSSGASIAAGETTDLALTSSSPTGEFSSSATSWKAVTTLTMSSNSANRNFYYRDSVAGTHDITVVATGRTSGTRATASAKAYIGTLAAAQAPAEAEDENESSESSSSTTGGSATAPKITEAKFVVSAGAARSGLIRTPIDFRAITDAAKEVIDAGITYQWSFGDGATAYGATVSHAYDYAGEYVVSLNAYALGRNISHRVVVTVREPKLELVSFSDGVIEILNAEKADANLNLWQLSNGRQRFQFPKDTIIPAGKRLMLSSRISKLRLSEGASLSLSDPESVTYMSKDFSVKSTLANASPNPVSGALSLADEISASSVIARVGTPAPTQSSYVVSNSTHPVSDSSGSNTRVVAVVQSTSGVKGSTGSSIQGSKSAPRVASENARATNDRDTISQTGSTLGSLSSKTSASESSLESTGIAGENSGVQKQSVGTRFVLWLRGLLSGK